MWLTLLFVGTAAVFLAMTSATLFHLQWARRLPALSDLGTARPYGGANDDRVQCSVVVAARDEESRIEDTVRHLLAQRDVPLEVIVVDDRSTDRTDEILRRLAQHDDRVRTQRVHELPDGWLGKCHACHLGAASAKGDWILFTDADCWLKPDVIARALRVAEREGSRSRHAHSGDRREKPRRPGMASGFPDHPGELVLWCEPRPAEGVSGHGCF